MYYIIYQTTNKITGHIYIGMHQTTNLDDGYLGSGKRLLNAVKKYGEGNFERIILRYCNTYEEMVLLEKEYITEDVVQDPKTYNIALGGKGGWAHVPNGNKGLMWINDGRNHRKIPNGNIIPTGWTKGLSKELKEKNSQSNQGKKKHTEEYKELRRQLMLENNPVKNPEVREKISKTLQHRAPSPNCIKKRKESIWITDGQTSKFHDQQKAIPEGWRRGRHARTMD